MATDDFLCDPQENATCVSDSAFGHTLGPTNVGQKHCSLFCEFRHAAQGASISSAESSRLTSVAVQWPSRWRNFQLTYLQDSSLPTAQRLRLVSKCFHGFFHNIQQMFTSLSLCRLFCGFCVKLGFCFVPSPGSRSCVPNTSRQRVFIQVSHTKEAENSARKPQIGLMDISCVFVSDGFEATSSASLTQSRIVRFWMTSTKNLSLRHQKWTWSCRCVA